jgi:DNA-binding NtrC family response regulator
MKKEYEELNLHQKMVILIQELIENELPIKDALREFEKIYIELAAKKYKGNKTKMAKALGLHRNTLHNLTKALNIKN